MARRRTGDGPADAHLSSIRAGRNVPSHHLSNIEAILELKTVTAVQFTHEVF
jgi:hypothetical protein